MLEVSEHKKLYPKEWWHLPSVTEVTDILAKPRLIAWYKNRSRKDIDAESKKSTDIGTTVHKVIEDIEKLGKIEVDTPHAEEVKNAVSAYMSWKKDKVMKLVASEMKFKNDTFGYIGTIDRIFISDGKLIIVDWKTAKSIYPEAKIQLMAYKRGYEFVHKEKIDECWIIRLDKSTGLPEPYMIPKEGELATFNVFLNLLGTFNWLKKEDEINDRKHAG